IMGARNAMYDRGILRSYDLGARTISVGNLTTGGTGKTPLVALVAEILAANGEKVCILTRGYGRAKPKWRVLVSDGVTVLVEADTGGDEPVEISKKLLGKAIVIADANRVAAAKWTKENFEITTFILDDGFQHRRAKRDLDIVCIDATDPCGNGKMLPAGSLRESIAGLNRADAIVITRSDQADNVADTESRIRAGNSSAPIFKASTRINRFVLLDDFLEGSHFHGSESLPRDSFAFCGIGNPENFFRTLEKFGAEFVAGKAFKDHFNYRQADIESVENRAKKAGANILVTTGKDAVKLKALSFTMPCYVALTDKMIGDFDDFKKLILASS
ncbi:MAG: tetraacyldisaccharide 4'-kinase, partial [Pyrinomonadaceae bacterium]